jgi:hypothetical protein
MKRCLAEGSERFELWVAAAVLANNLMEIAALLADRSSRRRKAALQYPFESLACDGNLIRCTSVQPLHRLPDAS